MWDEAGDVIITAAVAMVFLAGGPGAARAAFAAHLAAMLTRTGLDAQPTPALAAGKHADPR